MFVPALDVDWAAHLGGLISGFTASFLCFAPKIKTKHYAIFWFFVGLAMNIVMYITKLVPVGVGRFGMILIDNPNDLFVHQATYLISPHDRISSFSRRDSKKRRWILT